MIVEGSCFMLNTCKKPRNDCYIRHIARCTNNPEYGIKDNNKKLNTLEMIDEYIKSGCIKEFKTKGSSENTIEKVGNCGEFDGLSWNNNKERIFPINPSTMDMEWEEIETEVLFEDWEDGVWYITKNDKKYYLPMKILSGKVYYISSGAPTLSSIQYNELICKEWYKYE